MKMSNAQAVHSSILMMLRLMDKFLQQRELAAKIARRKPPVPMHYTRSIPRRVRQRSNPRRGWHPSAKRFPFNAKVVIHKNGRYIKGKAHNISCSGMFVCADRKVFRENERVRLYIRPDGFEKSFKAIGTVVRFGGGNGLEKGYGLRFSTFSSRN